MRSLCVSTAAVLLSCSTISHASADSQPISFLPVSPRTPGAFVGLFKRQQGSCQANHISCASLGAPEACCPVSSTCARDEAGTIACCPVNNVCVGKVGGGGSSGSATASSGATMPMTTASTITSPASLSSNGQPNQITSTVQNNYYPFPVIPTTYTAAGVCLSAFTLCQQQSSACFASLAGQNPVTISNQLGGGGVTQNGGGAGILQGSASSICSSLSIAGCHGIQSNSCAQLGNGGGAVSTGQGPRETGHPGMRYAAAFGLAGAVGLAV